VVDQTPSRWGRERRKGEAQARAGSQGGKVPGRERAPKGGRVAG